MEVALAKNKCPTSYGILCYQRARLPTCFAHGTQRFEFSGDLNSHVTAGSHGAREAVDRLSHRHRNLARVRTARQTLVCYLGYTVTPAVDAKAPQQ